MMELKNRTTILQLSDVNGAIVRMTSGGSVPTAPCERAFRLRFLKENGDPEELDDRDFSHFSFDGDAALQWTECRKFPGLEMVLKIRPAENGSFRFRPSLTGIPSGLRLEWISAPMPGIPLDSTLLIPKSEGMLCDNAGRTGEMWNEHLFFQGDNHYPGIYQMQFLAAFSSSGAGIYFAADDYGHSIKFLGTSHQAGESVVEAHIECCCGTEHPGPDYELPYDLILRPFEGDWQQACEIYREWVERDPAIRPAFPLPDWMDESPVIIVYPVRGARKIVDEVNNFIPYENTFPRIRELAKLFGSKVMVLLMRWDHNGPWLPPYYWPPVGGAESFRKFRDLLHGDGHLLGVYGSGTYFTRKSLTNDYSGEEVFQREHLESAMITGPHGEMEQNMEPIRLGTAFCLSEEAGRRILEEQTMILADEKVDFFQMLDQNEGGSPLLCYSRHHHHPSIPGRSGPDAMRAFLRHLNTEIRSRGSSMLLGTECAAAGPYIADLPFNDLRSQFVEGPHTVPVHAYQYVFHRHLNNFFGNGCIVPNHSDMDCMRFRMARGFCGGSLLTVVLRDNGKIDWTVCSWADPSPDEESIAALVRNLNEARRRYPEFLRYGDMIPQPRIECGTREFTTLCPGGKVRICPEIVCSAWRAPDGREAAFFVNYMTEEKSFRWNGKTFAVPPLNVIMIGEKSGAEK